MNEFPKSDNPMPLWLKVMLKESGGEENLANMMIAESPEFFTVHQVAMAKQKLKQKGWLMVDGWVRRSESKKSERWTEEEDSFAIQLWRTMRPIDIARELGRSASSVKKRLTILKKKGFIGLKVA